MKRPLLLFAISLICGVTVSKVIHSYILIVALIIFFSFLVKVINAHYKELMYVFIGMLIFFSVGAFEFLYVNSIITGKFEEFDDKNVVINGYICSEPDARENSVSYVIRTESIKLLEGEKERLIKGKILLTTLRNNKSDLYEYGRKLEVIGRLSLPSGRRNPGGFDYRQYLAQSGISATVFAAEDKINPSKEFKFNTIIRTGLHLRQRIIKVIEQSLPKQQAGLLAGMLIGYREGLSKEVQEVFSNSGLTHIMAVSGANVAFIVLPMLFVLRKLRVNYKLANLTVMGTLVVFVSITGFEPSVLRAVIMAEVALLGKIISRETEVINSISIAVILLLLYNPYNLFNIGFQLSFAATLSLILFYQRIKDLISFKVLPNIIADVAAATIAAQIGVLPISVFYFNKISIISIFSNIIVVPITGIVTILGCIMALVGQISTAISQLIGYANCVFLSFILFAAKLSADFPFAVVKLVTPSVILIIIYYAAVWFFLRYMPLKKVELKPVYCLALCVILVVLVFTYTIFPRNLEVVFLDVGEGDSIFIKSFSGKTVLIDGGKGNISVVPILFDCGVSKLDIVIATHAHDDHIKGLVPVLKGIEVETFLLPYYKNPKEFKELLDIAKDRKIDSLMLKKGDEVILDDKTAIKVLSPKKDLQKTITSLNNTSLVLKLHYKDVSLLFTGDIEEEGEEFLVRTEDDLKSDVLKVAHHGSANSSSCEFLDTVEPKAAIISVGKNRFGHPSFEVIERLKERGIMVYRTDRHGAVTLISNGKDIELKKYLE